MSRITKLLGPIQFQVSLPKPNKNTSMCSEVGLSTRFFDRVDVKAAGGLTHQAFSGEVGQDHVHLTPPKMNMEPEHDGFQKERPFPGAHFQVP